MYKIPVLVILALLPLIKGFSQKLPVIKATSKNVKIRDGVNFKENYWVIFPETKPDIYFVDFPKNEHKVTFITDRDSISFDVVFGNNYDFIILLGEKESCYTRISAINPINLSMSQSVPIDSIPFTMIDNRIYVKGRINDSKELMFQFDLGAGGIGMGFINHKSVQKVKLNFDKTTTLSNSDGANQTRMSSTNTLKIGKNQWEKIEIVESNNMNNYEDCIIGNGLFLDKYVEVDYNKKLLIIHDNMPFLDEKYKKYPIRVNQSVCPEIEATIEIDGEKYKDWFVFDTGNTGNGIFNHDFLTKHRIYNKFSKIFTLGNRAIAKIPQIHLADHTFSQGLIVLERNKNITSNSSGGGVLGNKLLKKYNLVLDTQQGFIYLKPSIFFDEKDNQLRSVILIAILSISVLFLLLYNLFKMYRHHRKINI